MTSNQVAYEVGMRTTTESERHNKATEEIQAQLANLEAQKLDLQDEWKRTDQSIQKEYNDAYLAYLNSSQDWKKHYEAELARLEGQKVDNDTYYKGIIAGVERDKANVSRLMQEETKRANLASEQLKDTQNWLATKNLEYQSTAMLLQSSQAEAKLAQELLIAREQQALEYQKLLQKQTADTVELKQNQERVEQGWVNTIVDGITKGVQAISNVFNRWR